MTDQSWYFCVMYGGTKSTGASKISDAVLVTGFVWIRLAGTIKNGLFFSIPVVY